MVIFSTFSLTLILGMMFPFIVLHRRQLVYAAEHRLGPGGDHPLAHAEHIDLGPLQKQVLDQILVQELDTVILHSVHPASSSIFRAFRVR